MCENMFSPIESEIIDNYENNNNANMTSISYINDDTRNNKLNCCQINEGLKV